MKKQLFTFILAISLGYAFAQSIPNGGFENWVVNNYQIPQGFYTSSFSHVNNSSSSTAPYNAVQTGNSYHGNYAIQLNTVSQGGSPLFAYVANGNPSNGTSAPQGGIPYSQQATGIRFYYKSNIMIGDTALVLVQFKKSASLIGSYLYKISSTQVGYTLYSSSFSPALPMAPDTVMFAAVSSNAFSSAGVAGNMLQIDSVSFTGVASQPTNFNGDFELWTPQVNYSLTGWNINNSVSQTTDVYSGNYALEVATVFNIGNGGTPSSGYATTGNNNGRGGNPYTLTQDTAVFYYKYIPASGSTDTAAVSIQTSHTGTVVGGALVNLPPAASYTKMKVPVISSSTPDSLIISFTSSKYYPVPNINVGSDLKVDNLYLMSSPLGVKIIDNNNSIAIQPNPSNGIFNVSVQGFTAVKMDKIEIYDVNGKLVETKTYNAGTASENMDISHLNAGIYNVNIISNGTVITKRVVVTH